MEYFIVHNYDVAHMSFLLKTENNVIAFNAGSRC